MFFDIAGVHRRQLRLEGERPSSSSKLEQVYSSADLLAVGDLRQKRIGRKWRAE